MDPLEMLAEATERLQVAEQPNGLHYDHWESRAGATFHGLLRTASATDVSPIIQGPSQQVACSFGAKAAAFQHDDWRDSSPDWARSPV